MNIRGLRKTLPVFVFQTLPDEVNHLEATVRLSVQTINAILTQN